MIHYSCDMCGKVLMEDDEMRYKVRVEVYTTYDPIDATEDDLLQDQEKEIEELYREIEELDEDELQDAVYKEMAFDLCPGCQKKYIKDPFFKHRPRIRFTDNEN